MMQAFALNLVSIRSQDVVILEKIKIFKYENIKNYVIEQDYENWYCGKFTNP